MTVENLAPLPKLRFCDSAGEALTGGLLFTYAAGTTTKLATYTDSTRGTPNANPIVLDTRGECNCWLDPGIAWKFTLAPATDTDPPTNPIWTVDQITSGLAQLPYGLDTGAANAYVVSGVAGLNAAPSTGNVVVVKFTHPNTGASTLVENGGSAKAITDQAQAALTQGAIVAGQMGLMIYDGTEWQLYYTSFNILANPAIPTTLVANSFTPNVATVVIKGATTKNVTYGEFALAVGLTSATGAPGGINVPTHYSVAIYGGVDMQVGSGDVWAFNTVTAIESGASIGPTNPTVAQGYELDFNNFDKDLPITLASGGATAFQIGSASTFTGTYAMIVNNSPATGFTWHNGLSFTNGSAKDYTISDQSSSVHGLALFGNVAGSAQAYKIDCSPLSTAVGTVPRDLRMANNKGIVARNAANDADLITLIVDGSNNCVIGSPSGANIIANNTFLPGATNTYSCGATGALWTSVWATNGTIQTSDPRLKTDFAPLPDAMPIIMAIDPTTYRWIEGGNDIVDEEYEEEVPLTEISTVTDWHNVVQPDGSVLRKQISVDHVHQVTRDVPVYLEDGKPHMVDLGTLRTRIVDGKPIKGEPTGEMHHVKHQVPVMVKQKAVRKVAKPRPGSRVHWGFRASDIKAQSDKIGLDWGAYVKGEDGTEALRPDQLIPVLWKALQEANRRIEALEKSAQTGEE